MLIKKLAEIEKTVTEEEIQENIKARAIKDVLESRFLNQLVGEFKKIESEEKRVSDIVINARTFSDFKGISLLTLTFKCDVMDLPVGAVAVLWGATLWVHEDIPEWEMRVYGEGDTALKADFPSIAKAKAIKPDGTIIVPKDKVTISIEKNYAK